MTNSVMFGVGLIVVLMVPKLNADAGFWISAVVVASLILAAPFAWLVAPRLRARYWRQKLLAMPSRLVAPQHGTASRHSLCVIEIVGAHADVPNKMST